MKKAIRHIAILLLAGTVLLGATGVSVHKLYCYCKGEMVASLFKPDDPCSPQMAASCCAGDSCGKMPAQPIEHDCSDCSSKYVKLDVDYLLFSADFKLNGPAVVSPAKYFTEKLMAAATPAPNWQLDLPPPPFGKSLLPHIQTFLC